LSSFLDIVVRTPLATVAGIVDRCRRSTTCKVVLYVLVFFVILYARRSDQLIHPQVWDEDGTHILRDLIHDGPWSILRPLNGYLVIIPRAISFLSLSISVSAQ
jgi:hypothetical protein